MARRGKTGGRIGWILFAIVAYIVVQHFKSAHHHAPASKEPESSLIEDIGNDATPAASYASSATRDDWPSLSATGDAASARAPAATSNYYVVLDGSGSMRHVDCSGDKPKIDVAVAALTRFVAAVPANANLGLAVFDDAGLSERVPLGVDNREAFASALHQVVVHGGTPLKSAIELAYEQLTAQARRQLGYGDYHLVLVTDGVPDPAREDPTNAVHAMLAASPVVLHTIGFCLGQDHVLNQPGRVYYLSADSPQQIDQGLGDVLAEAPAFDVSDFASSAHP